MVIFEMNQPTNKTNLQKKKTSKPSKTPQKKSSFGNPVSLCIAEPDRDKNRSNPVLHKPLHVLFVFRNEPTNQQKQPIKIHTLNPKPQTPNPKPKPKP